MNEEDNVPTCKQRFKAIEGFFRRVAFNLGNSPSQTEVKIISCIPIDVTDLQQKIFQLQKELEEVKNNDNKETKSNQITSVVHTAICTTCPTCKSRCDEQENAELSCIDGLCHDPSISPNADWPDTSSRQQRSTISFLCPSVSNRECPFFPPTISSPINTERYRKTCESRRKFFSRKKKGCSTQVVYRAQTDTKTPFGNSVTLSDDATSKFFARAASKRVPLGKSYLADIARRQFKAIPVLDAFSNISEMSTPVCRDNIPTCSQAFPCEPDLCSCCHGQFQNIDDHMDHRNRFHVYPKYETVENHKRNTYYDSNFYDLVPVKEKPVKMKNDIEIQKRKESKPAAAKFWAAEVRPKYVVPPTRIVNYCSASPLRDNCPRRLPAKVRNKRDIVLNTMAAKRVYVSPPQPQRNALPSKICCVDCSPVYKKPVIKCTKQVLPTADTNNNDANHLPAANNNNTNCPTTAVSAENSPEDKTETTLNQIKTILQTVLTEVKTNSNLGKSTEIVKKDAVVQNGPSHANMLADSQLLQSYTYSPYNIDPYIASCSREIPNNNYTFPGIPGNIMQQYPLLIQTQKHMCNCYKNSPVTTTKTLNKRATSAATNTEPTQERSKETEHLIKEIYKSLALEVIVPSSKDNTVGNYTKLKSTAEDPINMFKIENVDESKHVATVISELFRNSKHLDSSNTKNTDTTLESTLASNDASVGSERVKKNLYNVSKKVYRYSPNDHSTTETIQTIDRDIETEQVSRDLECEEGSDDTVVNKDSEPSTSETETEDVVAKDKEPVRTDEMKREKSGLFKKMIKMFKPRQRRNKNEEKEVQTETESDSDDYQTVYSQKVAVPKQKKVVTMQSRPHSKVFYSKQLQQRRSRPISPDKNHRTSPYMEQEYRRYWDEKLMFQQSQAKNRYATDTYRGATEAPRTRRPVYYQNYEARAALVEPIRQVPGNAQKPRFVEKPKNSTDYGVNRPNYSGSKPIYPVNHATYTKHRPNEPGNRINNPRNQGNSLNYAKTNHENNTSIRPHFITTKSGQRPLSAKGLSWLKKRKLAIKCGQQWKELILEG